jgi:hypothetical protein
MKSIGNFFIFCSGAYKDILELCPTERAKYQGIGATIFFTAVLATFSGGYAIHFVFENLAFSIPFGFLWGIIIFNLDRYIVLSIKKTGVFKEEALFVLPRFLIALVLAITISKPLELRLFENRISKQLGKENQASINEFDQQYKYDITGITDQLSSLDNALILKKQEIFNKDPEYVKLAVNKSSLGIQKDKIDGYITSNNKIIVQGTYFKIKYDNDGNLYTVKRYTQAAVNAIGDNKIKRTDLQKVKGDLDENEEKIKKRERELATLVKLAEDENQQSKGMLTQQLESKKINYPIEKAQKQMESAKNTDLLARLESLGNLKSFGNSVWWASLVITLLFILLETAPVTVKLLSKRGPYDEILERIEYEIFIEQKRIISEINDNINRLMNELQQMNKMKGDVRLNAEKAKLDAELKANQSLLQKIALRQEELAQVAIEKWYLDEKERLTNDPKYNFINNGNVK